MRDMREVMDAAFYDWRIKSAVSATLARREAFYAGYAAGMGDVLDKMNPLYGLRHEQDAEPPR